MLYGFSFLGLARTIAEACGWAVLGLAGVILLSWIYDLLDRNERGPLSKWQDRPK